MAEINIHKLVEQIRLEYMANLEAPQRDLWKGSRYEWIKQIESNVAKGGIGEKIARSFHIANGKIVTDRTSKQNDFVTIGRTTDRVENKLSCLNIDGTFKWLSIRIQEDYNKLSLVGVYPNSVSIWHLPKRELLRLHDRKKLGYSNGGKNHKTHVFIAVDAFDIPRWLDKWRLI